MLNSILLALVSVIFAVGGATSLTSVSETKEEQDAHIIVQLEGATDGFTTQSVIRKQDNLLRVISNSITDNYTVTNRVTNVTNAIIMDVPSSYVSQIRHLDAVQAVDYNKIHNVTYFDGANYEITLQSKARLSAAHTASDNASAETMNVPASSSQGEGVFVAVLDTSFRLTHEAFSALDAGVSLKVTQESLLPIISGSSFHGRPDGTHSTYFNNKVPFFYDYGGDTSVKNVPGTPDYDVASDLSEHGTHVASIIGANGPYKGIAPKSQLALMKVFTAYTPTPADAKLGYTADVGAYDEPILLALEDAAKIGVDIVNMSLGSDLDDFDGNTIVQSTIRQMQESGINVNVAAGNSGKGMYKQSAYENWSTDVVETGIISSYANNSGATTVAAAQANWEFYQECMLVAGSNVSYYDQVTNYTSTDGEVKYDVERHLKDLTTGGVSEFGWVKVPNFGDVADYNTISVAGKIAVVDRGDLSFTAKVQNAVSKGAIAVIIINNDASETDFTFRMDFGGYSPTVPVVSVLFRDKTTFDNAQSGILSILINTFADNPTAHQVTDFTSDGATYNLDLKPEISAPGQNIKGAVISSDTAYDYLSGTSMATPNYCGAQALLLSNHLAEAGYKESLTSRIMSTATPLKDAHGVNHTSVRIQGAGMVDVSAADSSSVYLEGLNDAGTAGISKAKIQLRNNADIKAGNVKLSFLAHNSAATSLVYNAKVSVYRPSIATYDAERYPELTGNYASILDTSIGEFTQQVTINPGDSTINMNTYALSSQAKEAINAAFEYGCSIEGYVVLTPVQSGTPTLSIPFYGFYGDYSAASPVEPFTFEREEGKAYQSDVVNALAVKGLGLKGADYRSGWVTGYFPDFDSVSMEGVIYNESSIFTMKDANKKTMTTVGTNPYTGEVSADNIFIGNNASSNTMIIQQFVTRSVSTNYITLTNKATDEVVLTDHMFDSLFGSSEEGHENYSLYKSHASADYLSSGIVAHRAYSIIPTYDTKTNVFYADGEYEISFNYTITATGQTYELHYTINIDSGVPTVKSVDSVKKGGKAYLRIRYNESNITYAAVNGEQVEALKDNVSSYVDILQKDFADSDKVFFKTYNLALSSGYMITHISDDYHIAIENETLLMSYDFTTKITEGTAESGKVNRTFEIAVKKSATKVTLADGMDVTIKLTEGLDPATLKVYDIDASSVETEAEVTVSGYYATFHSVKGNFRMVSDRVSNPPEFIKTGSSGGCGGSIATTSILLSATALACVLFVIIKRRKFTAFEK
ncbi:MAG TPA: S8 family serine peptidase [Bacilli bacterium]|nr:S8 family serine peptidase [Bacilli bacterium]